MIINRYISVLQNVVLTLAEPTLTKPSPCLSISTSPSTASVPLRSLSFLSCSSSACVRKGAGSSRTWKMRTKFLRATTTLQNTLGEVEESGKVKLRQVANSTPLGGRMSCRIACMFVKALEGRVGEFQKWYVANLFSHPQMLLDSIAGITKVADEYHPFFKLWARYGK